VKIRFQADADLNEDIVTGVLRREPGIDFPTAASAGLRGRSDMEVLALAATKGRVLVSHDRKTMPRHFAEFVQTNTNPGLFIISQKTDILAAVEDLLLIWHASDAEEWVNRICTIPL
jgi:predicted nuclease of predicted toxin-antitoxin system